MGKAKPTLLVMAGGTGGHIFPGLAVAKHLELQGWHIHWLGTAERMEAQVVPKNNIEISFLNIAGLRGKGIKSLLTMPFKMLHAIWQAIYVIKKVKPDVVLGMGGYASGPGGVAAWLTRTPLVLHEQNAVAGMTNKYLAKIAQKVLCAFPNAFKGNVKYAVVGNPVRTDIADVQAKSCVKNKQCNVLVVGGSLGAKILNDTVPHAISLLRDIQPEVRVNLWHQTGAGNSEEVKNTYSKNLSAEIKVTDFIDDMAAAYNWADVVICRAGALTVSELALAAIPAIFVPLPHAVDDHQTKNALFLVNQGAAKLLPQKELNAKALATLLNDLLKNKNTLMTMAIACKTAAKPQATNDVANVCAELVKL